MIEIESRKTAISRGGKLSKPLQLLTEKGMLTTAMGLFDWGHGLGEDMVALKKAGWKIVSGWDPHWYVQGYSISDEPEQLEYSMVRKFEWVYCGYVLNVIPDPYKRREVIERIWKFLEPGRHLCVAVRAKKEVEYNIKDTWKLHNDGWVTTRGTFQKGFELNELAVMLAAHSFENIDVLSKNPLVVTARKPDTITINLYDDTLHNQYMHEVTNGWEDAFYDSFQD